MGRKKKLAVSAKGPVALTVSAILFGGAVGMIAAAVVSGTLAYFTDAGPATNTFIVGDMQI